MLSTQNIIALVPAYNEEENIVNCLLSLVNQTHPLTAIIVLLDNCTDNTENLVHNLRQKHSNIFMIKTVNNPHKKAGALNQGYQFINQMLFKYLLQVDADGILDIYAVEEGLKTLNQNDNIGAVCSRLSLIQYTKGNKLLYNLQNLEYACWDTFNIERDFHPYVIAGVAAIFKREVLNQFDIIWDEKSLVEDFVLTLKIQASNFQCLVSKDMKTQTDYMKNFTQLWKQRHRWYAGTLQTLRYIGWKHYTYKYLCAVSFNTFLVFLNYIVLFFLFYFTIVTSGFYFNIISLILPVALILDRILRFEYIKHKTFISIILYFTLIPMYLYQLFIGLIYIFSLVVIPKQWE